MPGARRRWPRVLLGLFMVMFAGAALASAGAYLWLNDVLGEAPHQERSDAIREEVLPEKPEKPTVTTVPGQPPGMNILVMGSDVREEDGDEYGRSDTMIIVHVNPDGKFASVLSLPRDLLVSIPGRGRNKINSAYANGGPALAIRTVESVTGLDLDHYANIDFDAFRELTTALGGIYVDVDRNYFPPWGATWEFLDIDPGYQRLAGEDALDYVRFRHDLNGDFGRIERQQRFLRAAKEQAFGWDLAFRVPDLVRLVSRNVETTLGSGDILKLAWWGIQIGQERVRQVTLEAGTQEINGGSYVVASDAAVAAAVSELLTPPAGSVSSSPEQQEAGEDDDGGDDGDSGEQAGEEGAESSRTDTTPTTKKQVLPDLRGVSVDVLNGNGRQGEAAAAARFLRSLGANVNRVGDAPQRQDATTVAYPVDGAGGANLVGRAVGTEELEMSSSVRVITVVLGRDFVIPEESGSGLELPPVPDRGEWRKVVAQASFELMAPMAVPENYNFNGHRLYDIDTERGPKAALKTVYKLKREDQYLGIMQTTFTDAPAAAGGQKVESGGTTYHVVYHDDKADRVWWKKDSVVYWVSNTLSYRLSPEELLAFAQSMVEIR
jgi:polyisoprenyl-teichoic acid--peptidoglycan teichoic acid transferase